LYEARSTSLAIIKTHRRAADLCYIYIPERLGLLCRLCVLERRRTVVVRIVVVAAARAPGTAEAASAAHFCHHLGENASINGVFRRCNAG
jgi:hypothetical protein